MKNLFGKSVKTSFGLLISQALFLSLFLLGIFGMSIFGMSDMPFVSYAESDFTDAHQAVLDSLTNELETAPVEECQERLFKIYDLELAKFFDQINTTLSNKSSTSSLTNILIVRYTNFKEAIRKHFDRIYFAYSEGNITKKATAAYVQCSGMVDEYINLGKTQLIDQLKINSSQKKSAIMVEKFQGLNQKMADMSDHTVEFYSFYQTFNNKLFGFIKKCVKN